MSTTKPTVGGAGVLSGGGGQDDNNDDDDEFADYRKYTYVNTQITKQCNMYNVEPLYVM